jgi:hypothetical protein
LAWANTVNHDSQQLDGPSANAADHPIFVDGFKGSAEEIERQWFEKVYTGRGDRMKQLTWRAVLMGTALGGILSLTNLYIGLKAGWGFGVAITPASSRMRPGTSSSVSASPRRR